jgi:hypothetical protein
MAADAVVSAAAVATAAVSAPTTAASSSAAAAAAAGFVKTFERTGGPDAANDRNTAVATTATSQGGPRQIFGERPPHPFSQIGLLLLEANMHAQRHQLFC